MYIKKAQLDNFGKFHHKTIWFSPGLNVVYGENESGKSTLHSFLVGMLFGMEKKRGKAAGQGAYQRYEPWNTGSYYTGALEFAVNGGAEKSFGLERNFYHKEKTVRLYNQEDGEELSVEHGDLEMLLGGIRREFYENTYCIPQAAVTTQEDFGIRLQQELANRVYGGEGSIDIGRAGKLLLNRRKQEEQKMKKCQQHRQERQERLEWEQGILKEDIRQLEEKLAVAREQYQEKLAAAVEDKAEAPDSFLFRIPLIGWLLRLIRNVFHRGKNRQEADVDSKEADAADVFCSSAAALLQEQLEEKQTRLGNVQEEMGEQGKISGEERKIQLELKSLCLAEETLERVARDSYQEGRDDIQAEISGILSQITGGRYDRLELTGEGGLVLYGKERQLAPGQLSRGTMEQLYFALRLGVGRSLMQEEEMPILLDETFCAYDEHRLIRTLQWLAGQREQAILFTCQTRELRLLEQLGISHHRILL